MHFVTEHVPDVYGNQHSAVNRTIPMTLSFTKRQECKQAFGYRTTGRQMWNVPKLEDSSPCNIAHPVQCAYLETLDSNATNWNNHGCDTIKSNQTHIECICPKRELYTVLSDIHETAKYSTSYWILLGMRDEQHYLTLTRNILLWTNTISLLCSCSLVGITSMKMIRSRFRTATVLHFILCVSYALLHGAIVSQPFLIRSHTGCQTVSVCLYVAGIMITICLGCEMIVTFQILILGNSRIKIKGSLIFGLLVAFVTITAPSLLAANDAFGGDLLCLPSRESALFHTFVATMAANMLIGFIVRLLVECNIETPAFIEPLMIEQLM
ncbi:hypothetical protein EG68_01398 [Paragonimus skrjabini miyazakii]|uniref:Uncharacterized protein n=1 Tax=Paragonimus skrjabini miyazakii TaxID=59628 RepID=A0A8S9Z7Z9_9TREM|nr:hypothetical protein EG68_01398 [Paragonimus skrjabini miyazakii]